VTYWQSTEGERHRRNHRRLQAVLAQVEQEPERKGKRGARTGPAFREAMREAVTGRDGWPRPRARLALDLHFTTARKQPPNLENLTKHYLDQLSATHDEGEAGHLYADDRQVQLLHVGAHHGWDLEAPRFQPGIFVVAQTASDAVADMAAAARLPELDDGYDIDDIKLDELREELRSAERLQNASAPALRRAAPQIRAMALRSAQDVLLRSNDRWLEHVFWGAAPRLVSGRGRRDSRVPPHLAEQLEAAHAANDQLARQVVLGRDANSIVLPSLPSAAGHGARFRSDVRHAVRGYVNRNQLLFPLMVPTRLSLFVVQPEQPRDLDNILLDVLPIVDEIMKPPQEPWLMSAMEAADESDYEVDPMAEWRRRGLRRLRSVIEHGVWSCQVVELARTETDPPEGVLAAILGHGENRRSLWEEAADRLDHEHER
jgi:hypothetical protein